MNWTWIDASIVGTFILLVLYMLWWGWSAWMDTYGYEDE